MAMEIQSKSKWQWKISHRRKPCKTRQAIRHRLMKDELRIILQQKKHSKEGENFEHWGVCLQEKGMCSVCNLFSVPWQTEKIWRSGKFRDFSWRLENPWLKGVKPWHRGAHREEVPRVAFPEWDKMVERRQRMHFWVHMHMCVHSCLCVHMQCTCMLVCAYVCVHLLSFKLLQTR